AIHRREYKAKSGGTEDESARTSAKGLFNQVIQKAGSSQEFADAVKRSKDRMGEIDQIIEFNKQTEKDRKAAEADMKQKEAEAEAKEGSDDDKGATPGDKDKDKDKAAGGDQAAPPPGKN